MKRRIWFIALAIALPLALIVPLRSARSWQPRLMALPNALRGGISDLEWRSNGLVLASPYFGFDALKPPTQIESWDGAVSVHAFKAERIVPDHSGQIAASSALVGSHEEVKLWDVERAKTNPITAKLQRVGGKRENGYSWQLGSPVALSPDGRRVAGAVYGPGEIIIADAHSGERRASFRIPNEQSRYAQSVQVAAFSPDGRELAIVGAQTVWFVDGSTGKLARSWLRKQGQVNRIVWSPDGQKLALAWGETPQFFFDGHKPGPQTQTILSVCDARTGAVSRERKQTASELEYMGITNLAFSGDSAQLAWGTYDAGANVMNLASGATKRCSRLTPPLSPGGITHPYHPDTASYVAYSPDGRTLAVMSQRQITLQRVR